MRVKLLVNQFVLINVSYKLLIINLSSSLVHYHLSNTKSVRDPIRTFVER